MEDADNVSKLESISSHVEAAPEAGPSCLQSPLVAPTSQPGEEIVSDEALSSEDEDDQADEQPPVVLLAAVCGPDSPPMSDYEKLRERNIRERDEAMKEVLEEIEVAKKDMSNHGPQAGKKPAYQEAGESSKRKKVEIVMEVRRSRRERNPVSYVEEGEREGRRKTRVVGRREESCNGSPVRRRRKKAVPPQSQPTTPSSRKLRPRKAVNYVEYPEPEADGYIWCTPCGRGEYNGCEQHPPFFGDTKEFRLVVGPSSVEGKDAGDGVFNRGKLIPEGVLFGPYGGNFIPTSIYEEIKKAGQESGNAWEVRDKQNKRTVGFMDPGVNPDPHRYWMSKINCASKVGDQNLVGFQLKGQIYYRVSQDIHENRELFVWYGKTYAMDLGIKVEMIDKYEGKEDHTNEGAHCPLCALGLAGEKELVDHLGKGDGHKYKCGVKQDMEMIASVERCNVCQECGKGFKTKRELIWHGVVHSKVKAFSCDINKCDKSYSSASALLRHKKVVHLGVKYECAECGKRFGQKGAMSEHFKTVHEKQKQFKCPKCGMQFGRKQHLTTHITTVHEKVRAFRCEHCDKSFGQAVHRKEHIEGVHLNICYPCTWPDCNWTSHEKAKVKYHRRRAHTQEWSLECQLCEDQLGIWWGCILPGEMNKHRAKKHQLEWEEEQEAYKRDHPFICSFKKCLNRFGTEVEKDRHERKMH
jgi:DNA-directed RNA polymerase subunit RPC12/RpoP